MAFTTMRDRTLHFPALSPDRYTARALLGLALAALLAGCASDDRYPSLALRDAERAEGSFEPVIADIPTPQPSPLPAATENRLAGLVTAARESHAAFVAALPSARRAVAAGANGGVTSDAWAAAQVALADLDTKRSATAVPLGDLDLLYVDSTLAFQEIGQVAEARETVIALVSEQDRVLRDLRARVRP